MCRGLQEESCRRARPHLSLVCCSFESIAVTYTNTGNIKILHEAILRRMSVKVYSTMYYCDHVPDGRKAVSPVLCDMRVAVLAVAAQWQIDHQALQQSSMWGCCSASRTKSG